MEPTLDYSRYSAADLEDAHAHINREKYPENYAMLMMEIERRNRPIASPHGAPISNHATKDPISPAGCWGIFFWWLAGNLGGAVGGGALFYIVHPPYGPNYRDGIDWGFAWMGCGMLGAFFGGMVGLLVGIIKAYRRQKSS